MIYAVATSLMTGFVFRTPQPDYENDMLEDALSRDEVLLKRTKRPRDSITAAFVRPVCDCRSRAPRVGATVQRESCDSPLQHWQHLRARQIELVQCFFEIVRISTIDGVSTLDYVAGHDDPARSRDTSMIDLRSLSETIPQRFARIVNTMISAWSGCSSSREQFINWRSGRHLGESLVHDFGNFSRLQYVGVTTGTQIDSPFDQLHRIDGVFEDSSATRDETATVTISGRMM